MPVHLGSQLMGERLVHKPGDCQCTCCKAFARVFGILFGPGSTPPFRESAGALLDTTYLHLLELSHRLRQGGGDNAPGEAGDTGGAAAPEVGAGAPGGGGGSSVNPDPPTVAEPEGPTATGSGSVPEEEAEVGKTSGDKKKDRDRRRRRRRQEKSPIPVKQEADAEDTTEPLVEARAEETTPERRETDHRDPLPRGRREASAQKEDKGERQQKATARKKYPGPSAAPETGVKHSSVEPESKRSRPDQRTASSSGSSKRLNLASKSKARPDRDERSRSPGRERGRASTDPPPSPGLEFEEEEIDEEADDEDPAESGVEETKKRTGPVCLGGFLLLLLTLLFIEDQGIGLLPFPLRSPKRRGEKRVRNIPPETKNIGTIGGGEFLAGGDEAYGMPCRSTRTEKETSGFGPRRWRGETPGRGVEEGRRPRHGDHCRVEDGAGQRQLLGRSRRGCRQFGGGETFGRSTRGGDPGDRYKLRGCLEGHVGGRQAGDGATPVPGSLPGESLVGQPHAHFRDQGGGVGFSGVGSLPPGSSGGDRRGRRRVEPPSKRSRRDERSRKRSRRHSSGRRGDGTSWRSGRRENRQGRGKEEEKKEEEEEGEDRRHQGVVGDLRQDRPKKDSEKGQKDHRPGQEQEEVIFVGQRGVEQQYQRCQLGGGSGAVRSSHASSASVEEVSGELDKCYGGGGQAKPLGAVGRTLPEQLQQPWNWCLPKKPLFHPQESFGEQDVTPARSPRSSTRWEAKTTKKENPKRRKEIATKEKRAEKKEKERKTRRRTSRSSRW